MAQRMTVEVGVSLPVHIEKGVAIFTTDAASWLIGEGAGLARSQRKALKRLLGEDSERVKAHLASLDLYGLFNEANQQNWELSQPIDVDRLTAFRTLFLLPGKLADVGNLSSQELKDRQVFYMATSLWMVSRELGKSVPAAKTLRQLSLDKYEPYARVSALRFDMIQRMCELEVLPIQNPNAAWLIAEASTCIVREKMATSNKRASSKRAAYKNGKANIDAFADSDCATTRVWAEDGEVIRRFSESIHAMARELATSKKDPTFEEQYLKPYIAAFRAWNSYYFKRLEPSNMGRRRPGPQIGRKYAKC